MVRIIFYFWVFVQFVSCSHLLPRARPLVETSVLLTPPPLGQTERGQSLFLGGFSGLRWAGQHPEGGDLFWTITDRGPNSEPLPNTTPARRPFLLPNFQPRIVKLLRQGSTVTVQREILLTRKGQATSGRPNSFNPKEKASPDEVPVSVAGDLLPSDPWGLDAEALDIDGDGFFWVGEEYRPSLVRISPSGEILERVIPELSPSFSGFLGQEDLPKILASRRKNRGFEAIAVWGDLVWGFLQSPLDPDSRLIRVVAYDWKKKKTEGLFCFEIGKNTDKIGDAVAIGPRQFLIVEQNSMIGPLAEKRIVEVNFDTATNLQLLSQTTNTDLLESIPLENLGRQGVALANRKVVFDLSGTWLTNFEKIEGLALMPNGVIALNNDNDFGVRGLLDQASGRIHQTEEKSFLFFIRNVSVPKK